MRGRPVRIQPRAKSQMAEAHDWYEARREGLGQEFLDEVARTLQLIGQNPTLHPIHHGRIRRVMTRRFPYLVFYLVDDDAAVVVAVLHASRDPQRWP
jgi:toxin ParE1/3/4